MLNASKDQHLTQNQSLLTHRGTNNESGTHEEVAQDPRDSQLPKVGPDLELNTTSNTELQKGVRPSAKDIKVIIEDLDTVDVLDKEASFEDLAPSEVTDERSGVIKTVNSKLDYGYPLVVISLHEEDNIPLRRLDSIKHILDTVTNNNEIIEAEKRIRVALNFTKTDGTVSEGLLGTIRPNGIMQLMSLLTAYDVEGYLSKEKRIERKYIYALSVNK